MADPATRDETQLLIGGTWVAAGNGTYDIINPATEQVVGQAPNASVDDANNAAAAAAEAFPAWSATPVEERLALLKKAAAAIRAKNDELVPLVIAETGATASVGSRMQVPISADRFDRYSRHLRHSPGPRRPGQRAGLSPTGRSGGRHRQLQLSPDQHGRKGRPRPGHGQHSRHQTRPPGSTGGGGAGPGPR